MPKQYWLMKSEPDVYSIDDLARDKKTYWDGVRNYQARNFMRDKMQAGDRVFYYHSNAEPPGIAGIAEVAGPGYPDPSQFDPKDVHYDPDSKPRTTNIRNRNSGGGYSMSRKVVTKSRDRQSVVRGKKAALAWYVVDLKFVLKFKDLLPLEGLKKVKGLEKMPLLQRGQRLSVQPVSESEWKIILKLANVKD